MPVTPPTVNKNINPKAHSIGVLNSILPPQSVAIQLKIFIPVGTAIIIVANIKYDCCVTDKPTVYIWCAHTTKPNAPIEIIAHTIGK